MAEKNISKSNNFFDTVIDVVKEGIIAINQDGIITCYNRKAKELFGIIYNQGIGHQAGAVEEGDIVAIADSSLGEDDGGLSDSELDRIGIRGARIPKGSAITAIGVVGDTKRVGKLALQELAVQELAVQERPKTEKFNTLQVSQRIKEHSIKASIDFKNKIAQISVDGQIFPYPFIKSIGHMVIINGKTGQIKFYQAIGYTVRREDIKSVLNGKHFLSKGEDTIEMDVIGKNIFEVHPKETNINIIEFLEAAKGKSIIAYTDEVREINGRLVRCSLIQTKEGKQIKGAFLKLEDISELKNAIEERDYAIASLNEVESRLKSAEHDCFDEVIGQSESIKTVKKLAKKSAESDSTVLLLGESGTGKGLLAECIHKYSKRKKEPFVYINCASIPENLLESELFGYEGGSFTGSRKEGKAGLFETAAGGSIFLDEIGDIPVFLQAKLLHVLQNKSLRRIGGTKDIEVDVKIITATNRDLDKAVEEGNFREDLYYRINVFPIYIPPLRMRREDIFTLIHSLLPKICARAGINEKKVSGEAIRLMTAYDWPGNVRELENVLERAINVAEGEILYKEHLNLKKDRFEHVPEYSGETLAQIIEQAEKHAIKEALLMVNGNKAEAMKLLGIGKTGFYEKIKKYSL